MKEELDKPLEEVDVDDMVRLFGPTITEKDLYDPDAKDIMIAFINNTIRIACGIIEVLVEKVYNDIFTLILSIKNKDPEDEIDILKFKIDMNILYLSNYKDDPTWNIINFDQLQDKYMIMYYDESDKDYVKSLLSIENLIKVEEIKNILEEIMKYERF